MKNIKTALITGASKGFGFSLAEALSTLGWNLMINARDSRQLRKAKNHLSRYTTVVNIAGDIQDETHLFQIAEVLEANRWKLDLVVNNASALGVSPMTDLLKHPIEDLHKVLHTNMIAPISLLQKVQPFLNPNSKIVNVSSDAAIEAYETWGGYGGSKAGLDHMTAVLGKEYPQYRFYAFDPGDMRTDMHQAAFPGEDISDRPLPSEIAVSSLLTLLEQNLSSGRYSSHSVKSE